jgi:exopolysaccharide biosynthesis protein
MFDKRTFKKSIISIGLTAILSTTLLAQTAYAQPWVHEDRTSETIASGVTHEQILRFGETGWQRINVVRVNLKDNNNKVDVLNSVKGVTERETLTTMLQQQENTVAAINADFFHNTNPDSPLGLMVRDGRMVSSPVTEKPYSTLAVTNDGQAFLGDWHNHMYVSTENGNLFSIMAYNKITWKYHRVTMLDRNWGETTPGAAGEHRDIVEIIVEDDRVSEIRSGLPSTRIPSNGYVLLASGEQGQSLLRGIYPGERISFHSQTSPNLEQIQLAVGGGTVLVRDGRIATFSEPVTGNHPRTAVGINRTGEELIMVTVDGRHRSFTGVNGQSMASIMIELGSEHAILMDGGGSTTMATRPLGDTDIKLANTPSDGTQRRIINSLAVSSTAPQSSLSGLLFESAQMNVFVGHPISLALKGYDTFYQPFPVDHAAVRYNIIEGQGRIENQRLIPDAAGKLTVEATYQGKSVQKIFKVLSNVSALHIQMSRYTMNPGTSLDLQIEGIDPRGFRAPLSLDRIQLSDDNNLGSFQNGAFKAGQKEGTTILRASYNGHQAAEPIAVGLRRTPVGPLDHFRPTFLGYPSSVSGQVQIAAGGSVNPNAIRLDYDFTGSTGTTAAYVVFGDKGIPIIQQPNRIAVRVHAENTAPHWIRGQLRDHNGQTHTLDFKQGIDWNGWSTLEAAVPANLALPAALERVYVVETGAYYTRGRLLFDGIELLTPLTLPTVSPEEAGGQAQDLFRRTPAKIDRQWLVYGGSSDEKMQQAILNRLQGGYEALYLTGSVSPDTRITSGNKITGGTSGYSSSLVNDQLLLFLTTAVTDCAKPIISNGHGL